MGVTITDAQVHVWLPEAADRPWPAEGRTFAHGPELSVERVSAEMAGAGVAAAVLVPPSFEGDRNDVCLAAARRFPDRFRVMGRIDLTDPGARALVPAWLDQPGMLGIRMAFSRGAAAGWLTDGTADWLWPAAEAAGVPLMVFPPGNLDTIGRVARHHPGLRLVIDHLGVATESRDDRIDPALTELVGLARYANVAVKASCLPSMVTDDYPFRSLHDRLRRVVGEFGPRRVFWGSDLSRLRCPYRQAVSMVTDELDFLPAGDLEWVLGRGLREWLGWKD